MSTSRFAAGSKFEMPSHPELEGRRVFLSGVSDGTGEAIANGFALQSTRLVLHSRQPAGPAALLADALKPKASALRLFSGNVGPDQAACERLARAGLGAFGGLDLLINLIDSSPVDLNRYSSNQAFEDQIADDLRPALVLSRALADHSRNAGQSASVMHVCLMQSGTGAQFARYAMLKAALELMVADQARKWFSHDICVYGFLPGMAGEPFDEPVAAENVVSAHSSFEVAVSAILLNAACGRSRWLNGVTVAVPV